ncbi:MAG: hypothetical protein IJ874_00650 [Ruminococcus sp.]|nr:hypothetical protein [Ruminococcus sp.]
MKNLTRRITAAAVLLCIASSSVTGCSVVNRHKSSSSSSADESSAVLGYDFEWVVPEDDDTDVDPALNDPDPVADSSESAVTTKAGSSTSYEVATTAVKVTDASGNTVTTAQVVTQADGQPKTETQTVTDASGAAVTDAQGVKVTEVVTVTTIVEQTEIVNVTDNSGQNVTQPVSGSGSGTQTTPAAEYTPKNKGRYAMWLDISKDANFLFEGQFLKVTFKVKDDIPDGDYTIRVAPDLSDVTGTTIYPSKVINGTLRVNNGDIDPVDVSSETGMVIYGDNIACKQGDTVDFYINIKNNTGLVAFMVWVYYDANAVDILSNGTAGDFAEIARNGVDSGDSREGATEAQ